MNDLTHDPEDLADQLDAMMASDGAKPPSRRDDPLLDAAARLASSPRPRLSLAAKQRIQAQVLAAHREQMQKAQPRARRGLPARAPFLRWATMAGLALVILFAAWLRPAVADSLPGDALYPVKRGIEQVELALATSAEAKASVYLSHAERRAEEAHTLFARGEFAAEVVNAALDDMVAAAAAVDATVTEAARLRLQERTMQISALLGATLGQAHGSGLFSEETLEPLAVAVAATQSSGALLLPPIAPTHTPMPPETPLSAPGATPPPTAGSPPAHARANERKGFPVGVVVEGVIEAVGAGTVTLKGEVYPLADDVDPALLVVGQAATLTLLFIDGEVTVSAVGPASGAALDARHPVGAAIASAAGVPYEDVMRLKETEKLGFGHIARAFLVAAATGTDAAEVVAAFERGDTWDQILWAYGVDPAAFTNGRIMSAQGTFEGITSPGGQGSGAPPGQSGEAPGRSGDAPGRGGQPPGNSDDAPGRGGQSPGNSDDAPGRNDGNAPGHGGVPPGQGGTPPGQGKKDS